MENYEEQKRSNELANRLWDIANTLRGNMDASKFKNYILGIIFYRYLSEKTEQYINEILKDDGLTYRNVSSNPELEKVARDWSLEHLGYIIEPEFLFSNMVANIPESETQSMEWSSGKHKLFSVEDLESAISKLTGSTIGRPSEAAFDKLFDDMNLQDKDLGREVSDRTKLIGEVMLKVSLISFGSDAGFDVLGTAYMILIGLFASDAGKKGGEYFTPTCASSLLAKLASLGKSEVNNVCDPCAGSGSLLLQIRDNVPTHRVGHYYAGEKNGSTYNLLRMNLLMHDVPYNEFTAFNADTLGPDNFVENGRPVLFDVQVSNPPFSAKWNDSLKMLEDPRFSAPGELAPHSKADLAFVEHMVSHMSDDGAIAVILPHGALYRPDSEAKIREYLVEKLNVVDAVIGLPSNLFHGTKIPVAIMILKKNRGQNADNIFFMDASNQFTKINKQKANILEAKHIQFILDSYKARNNVSKVSEKATIEDVRVNGFKLNILAFVKLNQIDKNVDEVQALKDLSFFEASEKEKVSS